jgi:hypothetical protein
MEPVEMARRILPWYLAPRFNNVISKVEIKGKKAIVNRNVEIYVTSNMPYVFVPMASMMLYVPYLNSEFSIRRKNESETIVTINKIDGFVAGYLPDGKYAKFTENAIEKDVIGKEIIVHGEPHEFSINMVTRRIARINAAKYFANKVRYELKKNGWYFEPIGYGHVKAVKVVEGNAETRLEIRTTFFEVHYRGKSVTAPGIVPGVVSFFGNDKYLPIEDDKVKDTLLDFVKRVSDVGKSFSSLAILQKATKSTFGYVVGEADIPDTVKKELKSKSEGPWYWITGSPTYRGVRSNYYLDLESNKIVLTLTFVPFSPPASLVLNYPPFHIAPLSAMVNERMNQLKYFADVVPDRLKRIGVDGTLYVDELEPLKDAGVRFDDIRRILREGYPKLSTLDKLLEKMDRISYLGDIASMTYGSIRKIDELLVSSIQPKKKEEQVEPEEVKKEKEEFEDISL